MSKCICTKRCFDIREWREGELRTLADGEKCPAYFKMVDAITPVEEVPVEEPETLASIQDAEEKAIKSVALVEEPPTEGPPVDKSEGMLG